MGKENFIFSSWIKKSLIFRPSMNVKIILIFKHKKGSEKMFHVITFDNISNTLMPQYHTTHIHSSI